MINLISRKKKTSSEFQKRSKASKKGWVTRRLKLVKSTSSKTKINRTIPSEKLKKLQREERVRIISRRNAQKKGRSLVTDKPKLKPKKPIRLARKASKKRVSVR